jgi:hypothetical protein
MSQVLLQVVIQGHCSVEEIPAYAMICQWCENDEWLVDSEVGDRVRDGAEGKPANCRGKVYSTSRHMPHLLPHPRASLASLPDCRNRAVGPHR